MSVVGVSIREEALLQRVLQDSKAIVSLGGGGGGGGGGHDWHCLSVCLTVLIDTSCVLLTESND